MGSGQVRKGITQAKFNDAAQKYIVSEISLLTIIGGIYYESWYAVAGIFFGLTVCFIIPVVNLVLALVFSVCWSLIFAAVVSLISIPASGELPNLDDYQTIFQYVTLIYSTPASQVCGVTIFLFSMGTHLAFIEYNKDLSDVEDRNF